MDGAVEASVEAVECGYAAALAALAAPLLAWLAVAAAALGVWRIRAVASKSDAPPPPPPPPFADPRASRAAPPGPSVAGHVERSPRCHVEWDGTRRERFTAYFHVEDNGDEEEEEEEGGEGEGEDKGVSEVDGETPLSGRRRGDPHHLGWYRYQDRWYRYQDRTALSGNVVRLWGVRKVSDGRITATSPSVGRVITATGGVKREIHGNLF